MASRTRTPFVAPLECSTELDTYAALLERCSTPEGELEVLRWIWRAMEARKRQSDWGGRKRAEGAS